MKKGQNSKIYQNLFIKIVDFGLVVIHEFAQQSHTIDKGTVKYMTPEVTKSSKCNTKSDIYSLYVVMQELFCIEDNRYRVINSSYFERV